MAIVHDDDLARLDLLGDNAVSRNLGHAVRPTIDIFTSAVTRSTPTRDSVKLPPKFQASNRRVCV